MLSSLQSFYDSSFPKISSFLLFIFLFFLWSSHSLINGSSYGLSKAASFWSIFCLHFIAEVFFDSDNVLEMLK